MKEERVTMKGLPTEDRPYEKLERKGARELSSTELLSIILQSGSTGLTALELAQKLLPEGRSEAELYELRLEELQSYAGIGPAKAVRIQAALELGRRIGSGRRGPVHPEISSSREAIRLMEPELSDLPREELRLLLLDVRGHLIRQVKLASGGLYSLVVQPRDVFREAVKANAAAVILCHNHPSGDASPSREDVETSRELEEAGRLLGIQVLDHIVIASRGSVSLREEGLF